MPSAMKYLPPTDPTRDDFVAPGRSERQERSTLYNAVRNYYEGNQKKHLRKKENEPDDNVVVNLIKLTVDRTVSHLFPSLPRFELDPDTSEETPDETWIRRAWETNGGVLFLSSLAQNGSFAGHNYVRILPPDIDHPNGRLVNIDPTQIISFWRADDIDKVVWYEQFWKHGDNTYIIDFVNRDTFWEIIEYENAGGGWKKTATTLWNQAHGPIVDWKHLPNPNRYYGSGEVSSLSVQDTVNLLYSEMARIVRYHASPKTVAIGVEATEIKPTAIDEMWTIAQENASIINLEMQSELQASQALVTELQEHYLAVSRVVLLRGEVKDFQRVTNTGVRTVFLDMTAKNNLLVASYRDAIRRISQRLALVGLGRVLDPEVIFPDPLPTDRKETIDSLAIERAMKIVSRETASTKAGYHWPTELKKQEKEEENPIFDIQAKTDPNLTGKKPDKNLTDKKSDV
jgi:hypothetical protein